jgi:hypothetical protein
MCLWQVLLLAVRIVNPLHVLGNTISVSHIDGLKIFKLYEHPEIWNETIEGKKGARLVRMKAVRIVNPLHVLGIRISVSDIDIHSSIFFFAGTSFRITYCSRCLRTQRGCVCRMVNPLLYLIYY